MALAGSALFKQVGFMNVLWAAIKEVGKQVLTALANLVVFTVLQQALQGLIKTAIAKARQYIMKFLTSNGAARLKATLYKIIKELGVTVGSQLASKCGTYVFSSKSKIDSFLGKACDFIFKEYRHLFLGVCSGIQQGASHGHTTAGLVMKAVSTIPTLLMAGQLTQMVKTMISKLSGIHDEIEVVIIAEFEAKQSISKKFAKTDSKSGQEKALSESEIDEACQKLLDQWQDQLAQEVDTTIEQRIATPLLSMLAAKVEGYIESAVKATYQKVMAWKDKADLAKYEKQYKEERGTKGENEKVAWKHYEKRLNSLMERTRSPEVMKDIIANCSKIDMTCASAAGEIIANIIHGPVRMIIKDENGNYFEHVSGKPVDAAKTISVDLKLEHYGTQTIQSGKNSCLFDALSAHVPEFHNAIHDDKQFRAILGNVVTHDPYYRLHISSGWQSIAIQQDHLGGKVERHGRTEPAPPLLGPVNPGVEHKRENDKRREKTKGIKEYAPHLLKDKDGKIIGAEFTIEGNQIFEKREETKTLHDKQVGTRADKNPNIINEGYESGHYRAKGLGGTGDKDLCREQDIKSNRGQDSLFTKLQRDEMKTNHDGKADYRILHEQGFDKVQVDLKKPSGEVYKTMTADIPTNPKSLAPRDIHIYERNVPPPVSEYKYVPPEKNTKNKK
uniref:Uncharacterized protein n=1 Tax=Panagrolaimus superbus TaxID=310955 RepID=A0A914Y1A4_9BILA